MRDASGYAWPASEESSTGVLLPLRTGALTGWLRQDVRAPEVCFTMVGYILCAAQVARSGGESRRRSTITSSGARRAGRPLSFLFQGEIRVWAAVPGR